MSPDKDLAALVRHSPRGSVSISARRRLIQGLQPNHTPLKIEGDSEMTEEVSSQNSILLKPRSLIHGFQIQHRRVEPLLLKSSDHNSREHQHLYVFSDPGSAKNAQIARLYVAA